MGQELLGTVDGVIVLHKSYTVMAIRTYYID